MQIYEELKARGLIAQVTDEEEIRELVNTGEGHVLHWIRSHGGQPACGALYGAVPDEASANGGQPSRWFWWAAAPDISEILRDAPICVP